MKLWFRKIAVVVITIMTLGIYVPPIHLNTELDENKGATESSSNINEEVQPVVDRVHKTPDTSLTTTLPKLTEQEEMVHLLTEKAREQTISKLGPRIIKQVDHEFNETILPNIERVLQTVLTENDQDELPYYGITEHPAGGMGEKIFHVYDMRTHKDLARFHVRRDNRPQEGYWFNFHYHLSKDNFEEHHEIGEIYWDKNVPPKWMA